MSNWDDEERADSPPPVALNRNKFGDEEEEEDVAEAWDAEDSEEERKKEEKKKEAEAKRAAEAAANKKSKTQRIAEHQTANAARRAQLEAELLEEIRLENDLGAQRKRELMAEMDSDLAAAGDLLGEVSLGGLRRKQGDKGTLVAYKDELLDLATLDVFNPVGRLGFDRMKDALIPLLVEQQKKAQYHLFLQDLYRSAAKGLGGEQIKKLSSVLTTLANEKLKEEKAAEKTGKKSKIKVKASLQVGGAGVAKAGGPDVTNYDKEAAVDDYDDFM